MTNIKKALTAKQYFEIWHARISDTQAASLRNIKQACDILETYSVKNLTPVSVSEYCQDPETGVGSVPPAESTIRNTKVEFEGNFEHVYRNYIHKREAERSKYVADKNKAQCKIKSEPPTYRELALQIKDDLTRSWVLEVVQRWVQAEGSCEWMEKQLREKSKEVGGFDLAGAITAGPAQNLRLPIMPPNQPSAIEFTSDLREALEVIVSIPENTQLPNLVINEKGAFVYDDTISGEFVILSPKKWRALTRVVKGEE